MTSLQEWLAALKDGGYRQGLLRSGWDAPFVLQDELKHAPTTAIFGCAAECEGKSRTLSG